MGSHWFCLSLFTFLITSCASACVYWKTGTRCSLVSVKGPWLWGGTLDVVLTFKICVNLTNNCVQIFKKLYLFSHGFLSEVKKLNSPTRGWRGEQEPEANTTFWTKGVVISTGLGSDSWACTFCVSGANNLKIFYLPKPQATMTWAQLLHRAKMGGTNRLKISTSFVCKPTCKKFLYICTFL